MLKTIRPLLLPLASMLLTLPLLALPPGQAEDSPPIPAMLEDAAEPAVETSPTPVQLTLEQLLVLETTTAWCSYPPIEPGDRCQADCQCQELCRAGDCINTICVCP